jgi:hypothetical protein
MAEMEQQLAFKDFTREQVSVWLRERRNKEEVCLLLLCACNRSPHLILWYVPLCHHAGYH